MIHRFSPIPSLIFRSTLLALIWLITLLNAFIVIFPYLIYATLLLSCRLIYKILKTRKAVELTDHALRIHYVYGYRDIPLQTIGTCIRKKIVDPHSDKTTDRKPKPVIVIGKKVPPYRTLIIHGPGEFERFGVYQMTNELYQALIDRLSLPKETLEEEDFPTVQGATFYANPSFFASGKLLFIVSGLLILSLLNQFYFFLPYLLLTIFIGYQFVTRIQRLELGKSHLTLQTRFTVKTLPIPATLPLLNAGFENAETLGTRLETLTVKPEYSKARPYWFIYQLLLRPLLLTLLCLYMAPPSLLLTFGMLGGPMPEFWDDLPRSAYQINRDQTQANLANHWLTQLPVLSVTDDDYDLLNTYQAGQPLTEAHRQLLKNHAATLQDFSNHCATTPADLKNPSKPANVQTQLLFPLLNIQLQQSIEAKDPVGFLAQFHNSVILYTHIRESYGCYLTIHWRIQELLQIIQNAQIQNPQRLSFYEQLLDLTSQSSDQSLVDYFGNNHQTFTDQLALMFNDYQSWYEKQLFLPNHYYLTGKLATLDQWIAQPLTTEYLVKLKTFCRAKSQPVPSHRLYELEFLDKQIIPKFEQNLLSQWLRASTVETLKTIIALERFHADHQNYPDALNALIPNYLEKLPTDIFSGDESPLGYQKLADGSYQLNDQKARVEGLLKAKDIDFSNPIVPLLQK